VLGIGGGGDAVGSLAVSSALEERGVESVLGGVAWERFAVDPEPGPRPLGAVRGPIESGPGWALVDPATGARTPGGIHFCESHLAAHLGQPTVLIDVTEGPTVAARGIEAAAARLGCDAAALIDIGGDAIAAGGEPGLASPLCDAVMVAAGAELDLPTVLGVLGAGCDGELLPAEVLERVAALAGAGAWIGTHGVSPEAADAIDRAAEVAVTEASRMVARCARGEIGEAEIRGGRRTVELGPVGGLCFLFDMELAAAELPLVRAVRGSGSLEEANTALGNLGVSTELDYERGRAAAA
jgi:hypothetical protein